MTYQENCQDIDVQIQDKSKVFNVLQIKIEEKSLVLNEGLATSKMLLRHSKDLYKNLFSVLVHFNIVYYTMFPLKLFNLVRR